MKASRTLAMVGIGGPADKSLCKRMRDRYDIAAILDDIYTKWDANLLFARVRWRPTASQASEGWLSSYGDPGRMPQPISQPWPTCANVFPTSIWCSIKSGGDNLAATFSPELADLTIYVIDVAAGEKIPSKGGPGITRSDLLVVDGINLAAHVGASPGDAARCATHARGSTIHHDKFAHRPGNSMTSSPLHRRGTRR